MMSGNEQAVLTSFLEGKQQHLIPSLPVAYFSTQDAQDIFRVIKDLHAAMKPVDAYSVAQDKRMTGSKVFELMNDSFSVITLDKHILELKKDYTRRLLKIKVVAANKMIDEGVDVQAIVESLRLEEADTLEKSAKIYNPCEQTAAYYDHVAAIAHNVLHTGIDKIDRIIHGVAPGQVLTFLGRAGCFKTSFLQNCLHQYSIKSGKIAAMFSLEMPVASVVERNLQMMKGWTCCAVEEHFKQDSRSAPDTMNDYAEIYKNFAVVDGRVSLEEIPDYIRLINKKWMGATVGAIGIDYMGLIESRGDDKEYEKISKLARQIKQVAKDIHMPIVVLAQTNRTAADGVQEIFMHQGRGSGAIEEAADFVLGAFKESDEEDSGVIFKVLKNRRGPTGSMFTVELDKRTFIYSGDCQTYISPKRNGKHENLD